MKNCDELLDTTLYVLFGFDSCAMWEETYQGPVCAGCDCGTPPAPACEKVIEGTRENEPDYYANCDDILTDPYFVDLSTCADVESAMGGVPICGGCDCALRSDSYVYVDHSDPPTGCAKQEVTVMSSSGIYYVSSMGQISHNGLQHVACPSDTTGVVALLCYSGKVSVVAETCQPASQEMCSIFSTACGMVGFADDLMMMTSDPICEDLDTPNRCRQVASRDKCNIARYAESCRMSCGLCDDAPRLLLADANATGTRDSKQRERRDFRRFEKAFPAPRLRARNSTQLFV
jgi:hypothetical protein